MELALALIVAAVAMVWWFAIPLTFLQRDPLAVIGIGAAVVAFLLWAMPYCGLFLGTYFCERPLTPERLPAAASFLALAVILLLLRRR